MAVFFYDVGDHPAGFVGFRVATSGGSDSIYLQQYFSLNQYGYERAKLLADRLNERWRKGAEARLAEDKGVVKRKGSSQNIICTGLRAYINVEIKKRSGEIRKYYTPVFVVKNPGYGKGEFTFRTSSRGYENAYLAAVDKYAEIHNLSDLNYVALLNKMPDKDLFRGALLDQVYRRGHFMSEEELEAKIAG